MSPVRLYVRIYNFQIRATRIQDSESVIVLSIYNGVDIHDHDGLGVVEVSLLSVTLGSLGCS